VKGGSLEMGANLRYYWAPHNKEHSVGLNDFYISKYPVTQKIWIEIMGFNPSYFQACMKCPVETVSWNDAQEFIIKVNQITKQHYRLPTESEWKYAARGGQKSHGYKFSGSDYINNVGWYNKNSGKSVHPVGEKQPNELGIHDMTGNVWEWCKDDFEYVDKNPVQNNAITPPEISRVLLGGSWANDYKQCLLSYRNVKRSNGKYRNVGFRLAHNA